jgi:hypothetical protein
MVPKPPASKVKGPPPNRPSLLAEDDDSARRLCATLAGDDDRALTRFRAASARFTASIVVDRTA